MIPPKLTVSHPDGVDRIFFQSSNSTLGVCLTVAEFVKTERSFEDLLEMISTKPRHDFDDILDFAEDHGLNYYPHTFSRAYGPPPMRIVLPDTPPRYKFWLTFP